MPNNDLGKLRRSAVIMNFGPGAIIDFRAGREGAPVSVVSAGLDQWDESTFSKGITHPQTIFEPRLQKKLGVGGFRLPPVFTDDDECSEFLKGVRFPNWLQCPLCDTIAKIKHWDREPGNPLRYCSKCSASKPGEYRVAAVPVRFVTACQNGHLDDFPWHHWVRHKKECEHKKELKLESRGAGLAGLIVSCPKCNASKSLERIFKKGALMDASCWGRRPWLQGDNEECNLKPVTLQRGASNLYFPQMVSALDIPPWSDLIQKMLGQFWIPILNIPDPKGRAVCIENIFPSLSLPDISLENLISNVEHRIKIINEPERQNLRWDEYQQLCESQVDKNTIDKEFEIRASDVSDTLEKNLSRLIRVVRLREVRSLTSFTRIEPPGLSSDPDKPDIQHAPLSKDRKNWLPAIEVRGEGIFIQLNPSRLAEWEALPEVLDRGALIMEQLPYSDALTLTEGQYITPQLCSRFLLIHTIAHILMKQLSLECGYSSASLRERLFVGAAPEDMCGFLVYTSTSDSDGTLGGLQRQGRSDRFEKLFKQAIRGNEWCSSDPLCLEGVTSATDATNLAACHACVLAPETSCEEFNRYLDRAMVVGTATAPEIGFFRNLIDAG